jgi:vesicular inhibitory amino acid transporter
LDNFARSWTRAAGYFEVTPARQSFRSVSDRDEEEPSDENLSAEDGALLTEHSILEPVSTYGSISSITRAGLPATRLNETATRQAADLFIEQQAELTAPDKDREPLLIKTVEKDDGVVEHVIIGQSTLPQTVFNSVNVLVGIGLLSLPLGLKYSGW